MGSLGQDDSGGGDGWRDGSEQNFGCRAPGCRDEGRDVVMNGDSDAMLILHGSSVSVFIGEDWRKQFFFFLYEN